jgi:hypothetical protein
MFIRANRYWNYRAGQCSVNGRVVPVRFWARLSVIVIACCIVAVTIMWSDMNPSLVMHSIARY